ncbi:MAG: alpha/beta hydrolase [Bacteroidales bacterium]
MKFNSVIYKFSILAVAILLSTSIVEAAKKEDVKIESKVMNREVQFVVITPEDYSKSDKYPVMYLLHGFSGNQEDWTKNVPELLGHVDKYNYIVVCPDGGFAGWYVDSPVEKDNQFETFFSSELVEYIDNHYSTIEDRKGRAITGLSMGGFGSFNIALRHLDVFGAVGSMSGGVDIRGWSTSFGIPDRLGKYADNPELWEGLAIEKQLFRIVDGDLAIVFDCGIEDFFYKDNLRLHQKLIDRNIKHIFMSKPGGHSWEYWSNSIKYHMLFFNDYFNSKEIDK